MKTLVLNSTRFGDLLQTQPLLLGLGRSAGKVGMLCSEQFAAASRLLRGLDFVRALPRREITARFERDWRLGLAAFWEWRRSMLQKFQADRVLNLTPALDMRLLARLLNKNGPAGETGGFGLDPLGYSVSSNPWASFLLASSGSRQNSPFNIVDIFCRMAGMDAPCDPAGLKRPTPGEAAQAAETLRREARESGFSPNPAGYVGLQLGASEDRRRWPVQYFVRLGKRLAREAGFLPVILGSGSEQGLAARYLESGGPGIDLSGKTSLSELAAVVAALSGLVSNDTGTMHLAAGLNVPVAGIFLATAQPWDTGPYAEGSLCLEPDLDCHPCDFKTPCPHSLRCRQAVDPDTAFAHILPLFQGADPQPYPDIRGARVWVSRMGQGGLMDLKSLSGHENTDRTIWIRMQRLAYRHFLDRIPFPDDVPAPGKLSSKAWTAISSLLESSDKLLLLLREQGRLLERTGLEPLKQKYLTTWQRVRALWLESEHLNVLGTLWTEDAQGAGDSIPSITALVERYHGLILSLKTLLG